MASEEAASPASPPVGPADAEHAAEDVAASVTGTKRRRGKSRSRRTVRARRRRTTADATAAAESAELGGGAFAAQSLADSSAARPWDARGVHDSRAFDAEATDSGPEVLAPGGAGPSRGVPAATANFFRYYASQNLFPPGPEWRAFASSLRKPLPVSFRVSAHSPHLDSCIESGMRFLSNTRTFRSGRETVEPPRRLAWAGAWQLGCSSNTLRSAEEPHLKSLRRWLARYSALGAVTRQEVVSMIPVAFLDVQPGHHVLDMCAAPGSKTTQVLDILQGGGGGGGGGGGVSQGSYSRGSGSESDSDLFEDSSSDDEGWVDPAPGWDEPFGDPCGQQWLEPLSDDEEEDDDDAGVDGGDVDDGDDDDLMFADDDVDSIDHHTNGGRGGGGGGSSDGAALGITGSIMTVAGPPQAELGVGSMPVAVGASATPAGRHRANLHSASSMRRMYQQSMAASATTSAPVATPSTALAKAAHRLSAGLPRPTNDAVSRPVASQAAVAQLHTRATEMEEEVARLATALTAEERARQQLEGKLGTLSGSVVQAELRARIAVADADKWRETARENEARARSESQAKRQLEQEVQRLKALLESHGLAKDAALAATGALPTPVPSSSIGGAQRSRSWSQARFAKEGMAPVSMARHRPGTPPRAPGVATPTRRAGDGADSSTLASRGVATKVSRRLDTIVASPTVQDTSPASDGRSPPAGEAPSSSTPPALVPAASRALSSTVPVPAAGTAPLSSSLVGTRGAHSASGRSFKPTLAAIDWTDSDGSEGEDGDVMGDWGDNGGGLMDTAAVSLALTKSCHSLYGPGGEHNVQPGAGSASRIARAVGASFMSEFGGTAVTGVEEDSGSSDEAGAGAS